MNKLFVYGIFLDPRRRESYGMSNAEYAVVKNYATYQIQTDIVEARPCKGQALTGLLVDVDPMTNKYGDYNWARLDELEQGYARVVIKTVLGQEAYMYVRR